ncbi:CobN-like chelatase BtuS for metalloporphyrine salvage, partial [hydrothermal vent metagenome]
AVRLEALPGYALLKYFIIDSPHDEPPEDLTRQITTARDYWQRFHSLQESQNLLRALDGEFIAPCNGNDPIRNPDAVPTGCNLIGFDPNRVPTRDAWEVGRRLTENIIADYYQRHGRYPGKLAFSLWSLETMRHHGVLEAQILAALGTRPVWSENGRIVGIEIIPFSELGRPRVDVVVSATGLYRDAFPNVMLRMAQAIKDISVLKEAGNPVYRNSETVYQSLLKAGKSEEDARYLSTVRIFSNQSGNYGTGLEGAVLASDTWEQESKLADLYTRRMGIAFGADESRWSERVEDVNLYEQALSGTDGVIFSRSTNLYALLTNDDPFQYFGGIALAVRNVDGKTPEMFVSNLRKKNGEKVQTMEHFLAAELRARYLHPRWINQMQNEGYAGATAILDRMNNFWGWEVMAPEYIKDEQWQQFYEVYINDKYEMDMDKFFAQSNPAAQAQMLERMLEAVRKGYWPADDKTVRHMTERYIEIANRNDVYTNNDIFKEYVNGTAAGFGLASLTQISQPTKAAIPPDAQAATQDNRVEGQVMEKVKQSETSEDSRYYYLITMMLIVFIAGFLFQLVSWPPLSRRMAHG